MISLSRNKRRSRCRCHRLPPVAWSGGLIGHDIWQLSAVNSSSVLFLPAACPNQCVGSPVCDLQTVFSFSFWRILGHSDPKEESGAKSTNFKRGLFLEKMCKSCHVGKGKKKTLPKQDTPNRPFCLVFFYMKLVTNALLQHPSSCGHGGSISCRVPGSGNLPGSGKKDSFKRPVGDRVRKEEGTRNRCQLLQAVCTHIKLQQLQIGILICISL